MMNILIVYCVLAYTIVPICIFKDIKDDGYLTVGTAVFYCFMLLLSPLFFSRTLLVLLEENMNNVIWRRTK